MSYLSRPIALRYRSRQSALTYRVLQAALTLLLMVQPLASAPRRPSGVALFYQSATSPQELSDVSQLELGAAVRRPLAGGESHFYVVNPNPGEYLRAIVEQQGIDLEVSLLAEGGDVAVKVDNANGTRGAESISLIAEPGKVYRLKVNAREPAPKPSYYVISVAEQRISTEEDVRRVSAERALAVGEILRAEGTQASYEQALRRYEEAQRQWEGLRDVGGAAMALHDMGKVYYFLGRMTEAIGKYEESLKLFRSATNRLDEGVVTLNLGMAKLALGENEVAFGYYERALKIFHEEDDERYASFALNELGRTYYLRGDVAKALEYYRHALPIRHALNDRKGESFTLVSMGRAYSNGFGDDARALDLYRQALKIQEEIKNTRLIAQTLGDIGRLYFKGGDLAAALRSYEEGLSVIGSGDPTVRAELLMYVGTVRSAQGLHRQAVEQYYGEALRLQRQKEDLIGQARTLQHAGMSYSALGDEQKALEYLNGALEIWQKVLHRTAEADTRYGIALVESKRGRYSEAREQIKAALPVVESLRTGIANQSLRTYYFASVQKYYELYIDVLMNSYRQTGDKKLESLALHASESKRARALLDTLIEAKADIGRGTPDRELLDREAAIQRKLNAQSLRHMIGHHLTPDQAAKVRKDLDSLTAEYYELDAEIRQKDPRYAGLTRPVPPTAEKIQRELLGSDQALLEYSLGDERSYLWVVTQDSISSRILPRRSEIEAAALQVRKLLTARNEVVKGETEVDMLLRVQRADEEYEAASAALSKMLRLDEGAPLLKTERLVIVTDGELQYLPFNALLVPSRGGRAEQSRGRQGPGNRNGTVPLLTYHEIEAPPSMSVVAELKRDSAPAPAPTPGKTIAVIADPVFSRSDERCCKTPQRGVAETKLPPQQQRQGKRQQQPAPGPMPDMGGGADPSAQEVRLSDGRGGISRLGFTWLEAEELLTRVPPRESLKALGFKARRELITDGSELTQYRILHFATHGLLNPEHPELSGILLSMIDEHGRPQNGFLQMHEIYNLRLPAEMVVLSACDTGVGKKIKGEGLNGISRGFMYAGARRVVASLWKVDDASTSQLMKYFYENLRLEDNRDLTKVRPAAALRAAQLKVAGHGIWRQPYFWAAFIVQGGPS